ncbi:hypothetical protein 2 [Hubei leech virus 3]|uniref:hypothetical protein 2 n=1 Tax=Hubei leech virus 3 TaxID=1922901 RepID=UPI00090B0737|nr:hypothetical protein 2 [Hubei leech virus 3]APG77499.1 hypothetical protein 2 [Hubei leech virus 3]
MVNRSVSYSEGSLSLTPLSPLPLEWTYQSSRGDIDTGESGKADIQDDLDSVAPIQEGTVQYVNETEGATLTYKSLEDHTFYADEAVGTQLGDFFTRPVKIATFRWLENDSGVDLFTFKPWELFFSDLRVKKKLDNFAYLNCKLVLKFAINASPFYYGAMKASYTPLAGYGVGNLDGSNVPQRKITRSQRYTVDLNPQEGSMAIMELPFIHFKNWLKADMLTDFTNMGEIYLSQYAALRSANGVTGAGVDITIFAHAEDVHLSGPTVGLALQARRMRQDSAPNGWISGPASAVAAAAGALTAIPAIAPLARATDMAASSLAGVAQLFGFTNEPVISDVMPVKNLPFGNLSTGEISEPAQKLTIDPKQELALDTRVGGFDGEDEMVISNIVQRESWLAGTNWSTTQATDTILWTNLVVPCAHDELTITGGRRIYATPVTHLAQMFKYWRGDLIYRFKFIRSQYHRGRVRITWDPVANTTSQPSSLNTNFTQIVDLEDSDEVEIRVPYMGEKPFLDIPSDYPITWSNGPAPTLVPNQYNHNGILQVRVVNNLTAPEATSDVDVLVYVRAADNFEFAVPRDVSPLNTFFAFQSKRGPIMASAQSHSSNNDQALINFGERFVTMRDILHRSSFSMHSDIAISGVNGTRAITNLRFRRYPRLPGCDPNGFYSAASINSTGNINYNFAAAHPMIWLQQMYIGSRGSVTWNIDYDNEAGGVGSGPSGMLTIMHAPPNAIPGKTVTSITIASPAGSMARQLCRGDVAGNGAEGMGLVHQRTQAGLSANLPHYARSRFYVNNVATSTNGQQADDSDSDIWTVQVITKGVASAQAVAQIEMYACAGPDFNLVGFLCAPVVYRQSSLATPT